MRWNNSFYSNNQFVRKNICVVVPHEDDELLSMGLVLPYIINAGKTTIIFVTNGDYEGLKISKRRITEAVTVLTKLGVKENNIVFLGYADQAKNEFGIPIFAAAEDDICFGKNGQNITLSVNNSRSAYGSKMTKRNLSRDLLNALVQCHPDFVFTTGFDGHPDHDGLSSLIDDIVNIYSIDHTKPEVLKMLVHTTYWLGKYDYSYINNPSTTVNSDQINRLVQEGKIEYLWENRIRFPIDLSYFDSWFWKNKYYRLLNDYRTQFAKYHFARAMNSDVVFFSTSMEKEKHGIVMLKLLHQGNFIYKYLFNDCSILSDLGVYLLDSSGNSEYTGLNDKRIVVSLDEGVLTGKDFDVLSIHDFNSHKVRIELRSDRNIYDECVFRQIKLVDRLVSKIEKVILYIQRILYKSIRVIRKSLISKVMKL